MKETFRCEWVKCGKKSCGSCPHGPYWYGYFRDGDKTRKHYYGRKRPPGSVLPKLKSDWREAIFSKSTACAEIAWRILGLGGHEGYSEVKARFIKLTKEHHPDLGNDGVEFKYVAAAYSYLCKLFGR